MKKLCFLLALLLLLTGCGNKAEVTQTTQPSTNRESVLVAFDIYAVNDLHGKLSDTDAQPGVDELSTYLKQAQQDGNTLFFQCGKNIHFVTQCHCKKLLSHYGDIIAQICTKSSAQNVQLCELYFVHNVN